MPIADDWDIDYTNKIIQHVDGVLNWDGRGAGTSPAVNKYIRGTTSGAVGKIIGGDVGVATAAGSFTMTNTVGRFEDGESFEVLAEVPFDGVTATYNVAIGDVIDDTAAALLTVRAIEYRGDVSSGSGTFYGDNYSSGFADDDTIDNFTDTAVTVAIVFGTEVASSTTWDAIADAAATGLDAPGTIDTNTSIIVNYDAGTVAIPEDAIVADVDTGAFGTVQRVVGSVTTGSIRLIDNDEAGGTGTGFWTDNSNLEIEQVVNYDLPVAGEVFNVGDVVVGATSGATGRILAVIDDGDSTGRLILADETGTWDEATPDDIEVDDVKIAEVENNTFTVVAAVVNIPGGTRTSQRKSQGGIMDPTASLNIIRSANALYTYLQDTFDELGQMDDQVPMSAQVRDQVYTLVNSWVIPDLSMRFLEKGSIKDEGNNNIWANIQTLGSIANIGNHGYFYDASNPTPQPNIYINQGNTSAGIANLLDQSWLEGNIDVLVKVKTNTDPEQITIATPQLGQLVNSGIVEVYGREFLTTYDVFQFTNTTGGVVAVPLATADDLNNNTGTHIVAYETGSAVTLLAGEEITSGSDTVAAPLIVGIVTAQTGDAGATGTVSYALLSVTQLADASACTGAVSTKTFAVDEPGGLDTTNDLVAGYGDKTNGDVSVMTVEKQLTGGTTTAFTFIVGEDISQGGSGATGRLLEDDGGNLYVEEDQGSAIFNNSGLVTGGQSGALNTPTGVTTPQITVPKDIGDGVDNNYTAVISGDFTGANAQPILSVYEWTKYLTRAQATSTSPFLIQLKGTENPIEGRIYRTLDSTFAEVKAAPFGTFAGGKMFGAQGVFIDKDTLDSADLQNIQLVDNAGTTEIPPNLQVLQVTGLVSGDTVSVYRSIAALSTTILTNEFDVGAVGGASNLAASTQILIGDGNAGDGTPRTVSPTPNDIPDTGVLRVLDPNNTGNYLRFVYTAVDRTTNIFTLGADIQSVTGTGVDLTAGDNVFVVPIEEDVSGTIASNTLQYVASIPLLIRVREKGILPFETTGTFGTTGAAIGAIRTADPIVNLP